MSCGSKRSFPQTVSRLLHAFDFTGSGAFKSRMACARTSRGWLDVNSPTGKVGQKPMARAVNQHREEYDSGCHKRIEIGIGVENHEAVLDTLDQHGAQDRAGKHCPASAEETRT